MGEVAPFWWGFGIGILAGVFLACTGVAAAWRWLAPRIPVTGPQDTALTPDPTPIRVAGDPSGWLRPLDLGHVVIDPRGPEISLAPEVRRALDELPDGSMNVRLGPPGTYDCARYGHCNCWSEGQPCCDCHASAGGPGKAYNDGQ